MNPATSSPPLIQTAGSVQEPGRLGTDRWFPGIAILGAALLALALISVSAKFALVSGLAWQCPMMTLFHIPCPGCGSTRAFAALSEFRFLDALRLNPLMISAIPLTGLGYLLRAQLAKHADWGWIALCVAVPAHWVYLYFFLPR